ncbi:MAG: Gfo/Idh/MocA family oxidoreductase [Thermoguttaceae bacterium]|nr:Gfo/Idh/MocA family oxidoreductase [Thermoguttaceae bacterium]
MTQKNINVAMIGQGFMGRSHSNAWSQVCKFFDPEVVPVMHTVYGMEAEKPEIFAKKWGWANASTNWEETVRSPEIGLVDIVTPNFMHAPPAKAALDAGKICCCEKPIAATLDDAREMAEAARRNNVPAFVWYIYRRVPAVAYAHQLVKAGELGEILHVRASYLQGWADETIPMRWRFKKELAGSGAHGDLNAHITDMARFVAGVEVEEICGAVSKTFIKKRRVMKTGTSRMTIAECQADEEIWDDVTVDDAVLYLARFTNGAVGSFEATRRATGNKNTHGFEINGTKGSLKFCFDRANELQYYDARVPSGVQGWTTILCTHGADHPYVKNWWPDGHLIGYEHTFTNMAYDVLRVANGQEPLIPLATFEDAYQTQRILEAALIAAEERRFVKLDEVR